MNTKVIITGDLNAKHTDFYYSKTNEWGIALKKAICDADLFISENVIPTHRDSRTNTSGIIDYAISSPAIYNNVQAFSINNKLSSDHYLFNYTTKINKIFLLLRRSNLS